MAGLDSYCRISPGGAGSENNEPFLLSIREDDAISTLHSYGIHKVPHLGVYGSNYALSLPLVLLSLPPTLDFLQFLPYDILNSLDLGPPINAHLNTVAKTLVQKVLTSASLKYRSSFAYRNKVRISTELSMDQDNEDTEGEASSTWLRSYSNSNHSNRKESFMITEPIILIDDDAIRTAAKKLVRKVLHVACFRAEGRRSSIEMEYLTNNTKKLKINDDAMTPPLSPTIAPPLAPPTEYSFSPPLSTSSSLLFDSGIMMSSPYHSSSECDQTLSKQEEESLRKLGKRRQRSESHDAGLLKEGGINGKFQPVLPRVYSEPVIIEEQEISPPMPTTPLAAPLFISNGGMDKLTNLIVDMSIREDSPCKDVGDNSDDDYIIIEAITKMVDISPDGSDSPPIQSHSHDSILGTDYSIPITNYSVPGMDYYVMVHPSPPPGVCQKFLCNNYNEVNVLYHSWLFGDVDYDPSVTLLESVGMGLFDTVGIAPVHLDLRDAGIAFGYLEERTVCIHSCCFSPENAQFQILNYDHFCSFYSVARHGDRRVVTFHIVLSPSDLPCINKIKECNSLADLVKCFDFFIPPASQKIRNLLYPFFVSHY
ncbi:PREDICTED: uncharacterized protein LOC109585286 [Amphimedon queenslandica]|uniref:Uncharacterized protein n=1 Tax=Amphimedon queenslandica TaxID=400682 RepID=A0A1X7U016_AMPQE|nr:PREDICTED: uncharacterized protein LOC109585286 [Amphimedon queenslandica]|eukprot:XP_019856845.1 PREDICTED: uncharacterized protein LOC109585286 [Amphimedon queenslandica]